MRKIVPTYMPLKSMSIYSFFMFFIIIVDVESSTQ